MSATLEGPDYGDLPAPLQRTSTEPRLVGRELLDLIRGAIERHPRSLQTAIGPSEIGQPCARRLGYQMLGQPERPNQTPNWKATVGTAMHTWLEGVLDDDNLTYAAKAGKGQERWYVETRVDVGEIDGETITGSCDVFDRVTGTVVDWKTTGPTQLKKYSRKGPGQQYRTQAHLYGRGWQRRGMTVRHVMIVFLPRNGELHEAYVWHEPYDEQVAIDGLQRATGIAVAAKALGHDALAQLPTAEAYCRLCPFYNPQATDLRVGCPGHPGGDQNRSRDGLLDLIPN